jgi:molecular chaperone GrpE
MSNEQQAQEQTEVKDGVDEVVQESTDAVEAEVIVAENSHKKQLDEAQLRYVRLQADFDNFRKRTRQEKEDAAKYAALSTIQRILPALDNLERAIDASKHSQDFETLAKGVEMTAKLLLEGLQQEGLQAIQSVGEPFNPDFHQAVLQVESDEFPESAVVEELQKGYTLKDRVIRPAMVKVNKG